MAACLLQARGGLIVTVVAKPPRQAIAEVPISTKLDVLRFVFQRKQPIPETCEAHARMAAYRPARGLCMSDRKQVSSMPSLVF